MAEQSTCDLTIYCKGDNGATELGDCPFTQKALLCLSLHGLQFERKFIDLSNKPQDFLDLNKVNDDSFKLIVGDKWKATTPVLEDRKNKVRIFDSGEICNYLETTYQPPVLSKNNAKIDKIPGGQSVFGDLIALAKDVGSRNNGVINHDVNKEKFEKYKKSLSGIEGFLTELHLFNMGGSDIYLNGTNKICLTDIQLIPKLHSAVIHSEYSLNINIVNDKSEYKHLSKYMNYVYKQDWWKQNNYDNEVSYDVWRNKFGLNSSDGKYPPKEEKKEQETEQKEEKKEEIKEAENTGFYAVPDSPEKLYHFLCAAMSLELSTLPLYITALYSFIDEKQLSDTAKAAKKLVRDVIMEEMLHMNLLNNIISSIYGVDKVTTKFNIPYGKGCKLPANIRNDITDVSLKPFCKDVIYNAFIQIEAPTSLIQEHKPVKNDDGSMQYPYEPKQGESSVTLTFSKTDDVNQIGEFYNVIQKALKQLHEKKLITFTSDDKQHKQRQCKSRKSESDSIVELQDALEAIDLICTQGEGYELKEGVFAAVVKDDGDDNPDNDFETTEKAHFIKFIECLAGRELLSVKIVEDKKDTATYKFTYKDIKDNKGAYYVDFDKEIYSMENFKKPADDNMFNVHYKDMLEKLTEGLKKAEISESVQVMRSLKDKFRECMEKKVYPTFIVPDFPLPPLVGQISSAEQ